MNILLICGGASHEHRISLKSAQFIIENAQHNIIILVIGNDNNCHVRDRNNNKVAECELGNIKVLKGTIDFSCELGKYKFSFDVVFPMLHGRFGEDGTIQGWLELLRVPYIGCGVLASAICMDKDVAKSIVTGLGIKTAQHIVLNKYNFYTEVESLKNIIYPVFVKSVSSGSSIGVYKVNTADELFDSIDKAFSYDDKILIEEALVNAREIEVAVLEDENHELIISNPGEILVKNEFYSYDAKYIDSDGSKLLIPAQLTQTQKHLIQKFAKVIFAALQCSSLARIDFLLQGETIFFNEVNTMPGLTGISLYPMLLQESGVAPRCFIDILVLNAMKNKKKEFKPG